MACLYIVATPIGNLKDITLRALETLAKVDIVAAEDTRVSQKLLTAHGVNASLLSYHQHNSQQRDEELLSELQQGKRIALITDAGTPLISDPGHSIVSLCYEYNIDVVPIPGACAAITALCANNFNITRYFFEGFLPVKQSARQQRLQNICSFPHAIILYEAKHRIKQTLQDIHRITGAKRRVMLARELTKMHEQIMSATVGEMLEQFDSSDIPIKGEFVIVIEGNLENQSISADEQKMRLLFSRLVDCMSHKDAVKLARDISGLPKNTLYEIARDYYA